MVRRRLTLKRLDPWSVLKFGALASLVLLAVGVLVVLLVWFVIDRLGLVDQICGIALDIGLERCGLAFGTVLRATILLGLLWAVINTAVLVFLAFMHNLIADLTGGLTVTMLDSTPPARGASATSGQAGAGASGGQRPAGTVQSAPPAGGAKSSSGAQRQSRGQPPSQTGEATQAQRPVGGQSTPAPPVPPIRREGGSGDPGTR